MRLDHLTAHPDRLRLANEVHARPFPEITAPCRVICLALYRGPGGDHAADRAHLADLLERAGALPPAKGANHYFGPLGPNRLKWERHSEYVTYMIITRTDPERPFGGAEDLLPADWMERAPGALLSASMLVIEPMPADPKARIADWFVPESTAVAEMLDATALVATDFRLDVEGFVRFAVMTKPGLGARRLGRITQQLIEIENYKSMAMLALPPARETAAAMGQLDARLSEAIGGLARPGQDHEETLDALLDISAEIERLAAQNSERFSAARAYAQIVADRIAALREDRFEGRQTLAEFMQRRFEPAMRTVEATAQRLSAAADRAARAGEMLRTRTDVARAAQNQEILAAMNARAAHQLQLQETVEGLSVVAISYYALNLASYLLYPLAKLAGINKPLLIALLVLPVMGLVWTMLQRLRKSMTKPGPEPTGR